MYMTTSCYGQYMYELKFAFFVWSKSFPTGKKMVQIKLHHILYIIAVVSTSVAAEITHESLRMIFTLL
jgi:hypothetical protein